MAKALSPLHERAEKSHILLNLKGKTVLIESLLCDEPEIFDTLSGLSVDSRVSFVRRALRVGVIALRDVGTVEKIDYVQREFDHLKTELDQAFTEQLGHKGMKGELEKIFGENGQLHLMMKELFGGEGKVMREIFDPDNESTPVGRLRRTIESYFRGKDSDVYSMLDPHKEDSPLFRLRSEIMGELTAIKADLDKYIGQREVVAVTTQKGFEFEERVEHFLHEITSPFGDVPERVGHERGKSGSLKGDFVIAIHDPGVASSELRIVVEAKAGKQSIAITRKGLLGDLDEAMQNREAQFAIAVSEVPWPEKVGRYRDYEENKILCEYGDDGLPLEVAYRVARVRILMTRQRETKKIDTVKINAKIEEIKNHLLALQGIKATLTSIQGSSEGAKGELEKLKQSILTSLEEMSQALTVPQ